MIHFLFGTHGCGKTHAVMEAIKKDTSAGIHTFLIVPEQEAVQSERATLEQLPPTAGQYLEVVNFSRLYNRVCREYGGLCYRYVTKPIRHLLMWQNLRELAPLLEVYGQEAADEEAMAEVMLSAIGECKACAVSPEALEGAAKRLAKDDPLGARLRDLSLIYASHDRLIAEQYSDSSDDLARLYKVLQTEPFFAGCHVYLDSFMSYTAMEHKIIERIFATAEQVTVTVPLPSPQHSDIGTKSLEHSMHRLLRAASLHQTPTITLLSENRRATSPALSYLAEHIWQMDPKDTVPVSWDGSVVAEICDTPYGEAEAASAHILELMRAGVRCRDILILMRDPEKYRGIIEPALEKNDIPYFFSEKTDLCTLPPLKLLFSALRIKQYNWQKNDILSHIKTGMYRFSLRDIDLFEEYMDTWNIKGARFRDGDFTMNPDGFSDSVSDRGQEILASANRVRRNLTDLLERFYILLDGAKTVPDQCRAVYDYFCRMGLEETLLQMSAKEAASGNRKRAEEYRRLYSLILETLADIAAALPDQEADTEAFHSILRMVFRQTEIGTIPTSVDEVTIGSAATLRASAPKYTLILGLCEGEFPAAVKDKGLFTSADRKDLSLVGVELSGDTDTRSSDELMFVRRAMATPSHGLYLFTSTSQTDGKPRSPSLPFGRVRALFPDLPVHRYVSGDLRYLAGSAKTAAAHLRMLGNTAEGVTLAQVLEEHIPHIKEQTSAAADQPDCSVKAEHLPELSGGSIRFSSSRFEKYVECPFNYYCVYVLGLRETKTVSFGSSDIGTFIHYILEQLLRFAVDADKDGSFPDDETLIRQTQKTVSQYIDRICPDELKRSKRLRHLYTRLERLALLMVRNLVEEFSHSEFRPAFFELSTNGRDGNPSPMEFVLSDGFRVSFSGIVDRVDLLKKDDTVYVRIVDYKTGAKQFSLDDVAHGINIQMLLYLFTLCRNRSNDFTKAIGLEEGQAPTPAGILYLSAKIPVIQAEDYDSEEDVLKQASDSLSRSGLLLADESLLTAMNDECSPRFLAGIKRNKDGILTGKALMDHEGFGKLYEQIQSVVEAITTAMRNGKADAKPLVYGDRDPCSYCHMKPICRKIQ